MAAKSVFIQPAEKMAGLYFRHCRPYISLQTSAAKGDRAVKPETSIIC
jgi:hypothetical protein